MAPRPGSSRADSSASLASISPGGGSIRLVVNDPESAYDVDPYSSAIMSASGGGLTAFEKTQKQHERRQRREKQIQQMELAIEASGRSLDQSFATLNAEIDGFANVAPSASGSSVASAGSGSPPKDKVQKSKDDWSAPALGATSSAREFLAESAEPKRRHGSDSAGAASQGQQQSNLQGVSLYGSSIPEKESTSKGATFGTALGWFKDKMSNPFGRSGKMSDYGDTNLAPRGDNLSSSFKNVDLRPRGYDETGRAPTGGNWGSHSGPPGQGDSGRNIMGRMATNAGMAADTLAMCMSKRCACVFAALVIVGVSVGIATSNGAFDTKSTPAADAASRSGVNLSPKQKIDVLKSRIVEAGISLPETLEDGPRDPEDPQGPKHPQYEALQWLTSAESNPRLDPRDRFAMQRYALAVFYKSTFDAAARVDELDPPSRDDEEYDNWDKDDNWMSAKGVCSWLGVQCHHRSGTADMDTNFDDDGMVTYLKLPANEIRGPLPRELFTALTDLRVLDLMDNGINGTLPTEIGMLGQLQYVQMANNYVEGDLPTEIGECTELRQLHFSENWLDGPIPNEISNLKKLRGLGLFHNEFSGTIPFSIGELTELKNLYLDENFLEGTIPASLGLLHNLADLRLGKNDLTGTIPVELADLPLLEILYLHSNELTGTVPTELARLSQLDELYLYKNNLTGTLPTEFGSMPDLDHLYLDHCELTGTIPTEYGSMANLQHFFAYSNKLEGPLPTEMGNMADLQMVNLGDNQLTGELPPELGKLIKLEHLVLENNGLRGGVPVEMSGLHKMDKLTLHGNDLTGSVPPQVCDLTRAYSLDEFSMDCASPAVGGEREVECDCCTHCEA